MSFFNVQFLTEADDRKIINELNQRIEPKIMYDELNTPFQYNPKTRLYEEIKSIDEALLKTIEKQILQPLRERISNMDKDKYDTYDDYVKAKNRIQTILHKYGSVRKTTEYVKMLKKKEKEYISFDTKQPPHLLPLTNNKNINLKTGELVERKKEDFFTFCIDASYDKSMNTTKAERFFKSLMSYDNDKIDALQQTLGAIITGELLKYIFVFFGPNGDNGKTELCGNILKGVLGKYHRTINQDIILSRKFKTSTGPQPHMFSLKGGRCGIMSEINENERIDEMMFKSLSGGDTIETRNHHDRKTTEFKNSTKPIFLLNKPFLLDTRDKATLERMVNIEFSASFKKDPKEGEYKQDPELIKYLKTPQGIGEILNWIVKGSTKFYENGLKIESEYIKNATKQFVSLVDPVNGFMKSVRFSPKFTKFYSRSEIVIKFKSYLTSTPHRYNNKLKDAVYQEIEKHVKKVKRSLYGYRGLDIKDDYELDDYDDDKDVIDDGEDNETKTEYNDEDVNTESLRLHLKEANELNEEYKKKIESLMKEKEIMQQKINDMEDKLNTITITKDPIENSDNLKDVFEDDEEVITTKKKDKKKKVKKEEEKEEKEEQKHYSKMKVKELREYCKTINFDTKGLKKKEIIEMLDKIEEEKQNEIIDNVSIEDIDDDDYDSDEFDEEFLKTLDTTDKKGEILTSLDDFEI